MSDTPIFDRKTLAVRRARVAEGFTDFDFLYQRTQDQIDDRLLDIQREFSNILSMSAFDGFAYNGNAIAMDEEFLPLAPQSLDLVTSCLHLHSVNDLPGALIQMRRALKPDGLFIGAMFGGESLHELRESLTQAELALKGGVSPRVFPFADKQQMGALLQRAGFALPVVDSEIVTVTYENVFKLMADLRGMGESNVIAARSRLNPGKAFFAHAAAYYAENFSEDNGRICARFEIIYFIGWAPHEGQQQPLKPGSAQTRLADVLGVDEGKI